MAYVYFIKKSGDVEQYDFRSIEDALEYVNCFDDTDKTEYMNIVVFNANDEFITAKWANA